MQIDVELLKNASKTNSVVLRFYEWDRASVSIGFIQKKSIVPNGDKYTIVNRPTGGGVVFHDNDFTYSVIVPSNHFIAALDRVESYHAIHRAILRAFAELGLDGYLATGDFPKSDRATMQCFITPTKYDLLCRDGDGVLRKFAGSAQRRTRNGLLHQGSIVMKSSNNDRELMRETLKNAFQQEFSIKLVDFYPLFLQRHYAP